MCYWQSSTLCLTSLSALGLCVHRKEQKGEDSIDLAICPANVNEATPPAGSLMLLKEFFDQ